ncbi:hypothetical protein GGR57DRAFT_260097 [Xylariaceae sp. FL1272]|nr:hypothetical protein GGR57DRAFT_260097 [Xylariaceae sp. FL1272]
MVSISEIKGSNLRITENTAPQTAVFTGGTDGIGKATLIRLVATKVPIKVYVVGRNGDRHKSFLEELRRSNDQADIVWVEGQLALLAEVQRISEAIKSRETSIDVLFMSAGFIYIGNERMETSEGKLMSLALTYYGRTLLMMQLLPLLNASSMSPRVLSVLAAGRESTSIYLDDIDLKKPGAYSLASGSRSSATYNSLTMSRLAKENPKVVFIHHYPGGVSTGLFKKGFGDKWWFPLFNIFLALYAWTPEQAGEKNIYMLTSEKYGGKGVSLGPNEQPALNIDNSAKGGSLYLIDDKLRELQQEKIMRELRNMDAGNTIWEHTLEEIGKYVS